MPGAVGCQGGGSSKYIVRTNRSKKNCLVQIVGKRSVERFSRNDPQNCIASTKKLVVCGSNYCKNFHMIELFSFVLNVHSDIFLRGLIDLINFGIFITEAVEWRTKNQHGGGNTCRMDKWASRSD